MSRITEREVARRLAEPPQGLDLEPPADLLARLKADIPEQIEIVLPGEARPDRPERAIPFPPHRADVAWQQRRRWLMAASVVLALGAGLFAIRVRQATWQAEEVPSELSESQKTAAGSSAAKAPPPPPPPIVQSEADQSRAPGNADVPLARPAPQAVSPRVPAPQSAPLGRRAPQGRGSNAGEAGRAAEEPWGELEESITVRPELDSSSAATTAPPPPPPPPPPAPRREALSAEARRRQNKARQEERQGAADRGVESGVESGVEGGVVGGVAGGVPGGVAGGSPGGVVAQAPQPVEIPESIPEPEPGPLIEATEAADAADTGLRRDAEGASRAPGGHPFVDTEEDPVSTFGLEAGTASWAEARRFLDNGRLPPPEAVRVEEVVNYFSAGDRPPARGDFALRAEGAPTPFAGEEAGPAGDRYRILRFGLRARGVQDRHRKPATSAGLRETVARDARVQVEFNPAVVARYRLLGHEGRDIAAADRRRDDIAAGEVSSGHGVTALYEVKLLPDVRPREVLATLRLRYRSAETDKIVEVDREMLVRDLAPDWQAAPPALRLAAVAGELAEILRGSFWAKDGDLEEVARRARELSGVFADRPEGERVAELAHLAARAARIQRERGSKGKP
ncbi:MAG TPA: von Willebrand factor type A domain-containing protein [Thermoanaerobaculia bacterium]|nr:von Willebrand factor type A domain-containing protein [Thermoanaerobaculia bacterium]